MSLSVSKEPRYYLDWAATALPGTQGDSPKAFANPSSKHLEGRHAREKIEEARRRCAKVLGVLPEKLYFCSGGTEANAIILHSFILRPGKGKLLCSRVEHPSIIENISLLNKLGKNTGHIEVEKDGRVTEETLLKALKNNPDTRFISIMAVNNEIGTVPDISSIISIIRQNQEKTGLPIHFHSDMVQALGKVSFDIKSLDLDSASISSHKLGGPQGVGLLYLKNPIETLLSGGEQERGIRPGTENVAGAIALANTLELRASPETVTIEEEKARLRLKYFTEKINALKKPDGKQACKIIPEDRLPIDPRFSPWILQLRFLGVPGAVMVRAMDEMGFAISTGSACSSGNNERPVLKAMGLDEAAGLEGVRISQGWSTETGDFDAFISAAEKVLSSI